MEAMDRTEGHEGRKEGSERGRKETAIGFDEQLNMEAEG